MPRKYCKSGSSRGYKSYQVDKMEAAVNKVKSAQMSTKGAAKFYNINRTTLINHVRGVKCGKAPTLLGDCSLNSTIEGPVAEVPLLASHCLKYKVGFIGAGKMAQGIAAGLLSDGNNFNRAKIPCLATGILKSNEILASAPSTRNTPYFEEKLGVTVTHLNTDVICSCCVIIIAVKPEYVPGILNLLNEVQTNQIVVSIAAGITLKRIEEVTDEFAAAVQVIRAMPSISVTARTGVTVFSCNRNVTEDSIAVFKELFEKLGICKQVPESMTNACTGMVASGSAFVFVMMQALADGGVKMGIPRHLANDFALHTFLGSAKLVQDSEKHPQILAEETASPGGTTIHGLHELEKGGVRAAIISAVEAATQRAKSMDV